MNDMSLQRHYSHVVRDTDQLKRFELLRPPNNYLLKVHNRNSTKSHKIYSKLTLKTLEQCQ